MNCIRQQQMIASSSLPADRKQGISFRYPVKDSSGKIRGVIIESISMSFVRDKL